ncbi:helix-turn-helix domain-containing protein [Delftia sp. PS-11]|uniref:helix-turn-helix domain-containing protein n=1 Tax=Delftia sp. PS-11 TaxID=2767222 RepID=UPI00245856D7|nr:helix-turn-helix domain-containing protein [Delftia sp. PS-11]KAJ8745245.1 GAF domain-containing protein [Delftia sp. PS-11]
MFALSPGDYAEPPHADESRQQQIARARLLVMGGSTPLAAPLGLAPWLWRSWLRCLAAGRQPGERVVYDAPGAHALRQARDRHEALLQAARPVMAQLVGAVGAMGCFCLLTDAQGTVIEVQGPVDRHDARAQAIARVGVDLSERSVGTTAIGTALAERTPVWLHRSEHFFEANRHYSCAGAPLHGPDGHCLGMLDITGIDVPERPELLHLGLCCARAIEDRLLRALPHALLLHLNWPGGPLGQEGEGLLAIDADGHVAGSNSPARQLVPLPLSRPGQPLHCAELLAMPWQALVDHARLRPNEPLRLPLWSGLRLQALAQPGPQLRRLLPAQAQVQPASPLRSSQGVLIEQALQEAQGNVAQAARALGISRATLYRKLGARRAAPAP